MPCGRQLPLSTGRVRLAIDTRPTNVPHGQLFGLCVPNWRRCWVVGCCPSHTESVGDSSCLLLSECVAVLGRCIGSLLVLLADAAGGRDGSPAFPLFRRASPQSCRHAAEAPGASHPPPPSPHCG